MFVWLHSDYMQGDTVYIYKPVTWSKIPRVQLKQNYFMLNNCIKIQTFKIIQLETSVNPVNLFIDWTLTFHLCIAIYGCMKEIKLSFSILKPHWAEYFQFPFLGCCYLATKTFHQLNYLETVSLLEG